MDETGAFVGGDEIGGAEVARGIPFAVRSFGAGKWVLQGDLVRWPGIVCEVRQGKVWALSVDGAPAVSGGWPSPQAKAAYDQLDRETSEAIRAWLQRRPDDADHDYVFTSVIGHGKLNPPAVASRLSW